MSSLSIRAYHTSYLHSYLLLFYSLSHNSSVFLGCLLLLFRRTIEFVSVFELNMRHLRKISSMTLNIWFLWFIHNYFTVRTFTVGRQYLNYKWIFFYLSSEVSCGEWNIMGFRITLLCPQEPVSWKSCMRRRRSGCTGHGDKCGNY